MNILLRYDLVCVLECAIFKVAQIPLSRALKVNNF